MSDAAASTRWLGRIVRFPVTRILLFIVGTAAALWLARLVTSGLGRGLGAWWPGAAANVALQILAVHFAYRGMVRLLERRSADELCLRGAARETGAGILVGAGCLTVTVGIVAALGYYHVEGFGVWAALATALGIAAGSSYIEEVIFRGVVFRIMEEALGTWLALAITVALFGLAHLGNPNATLYGAAAIGIEAGMLLGAAYVVTRRLWLAIGVHFGWNFLQAGVFGPNLSGREVGSLLQSRLSGPDLLSGGALGVEGSVFAIAVCLAASLVLLNRTRRQGLFIRPFWRRAGS
ncbi:MAG: CPBP family intramembrane metalloprotease [Acidobacteria bacterium]|nr:CPBP family intramembrane metalloprotease [Acidobacteriota bacterium]